MPHPSLSGRGAAPPVTPGIHGSGAADPHAPVRHPTPSGTRDVLPDELRELRSITRRLQDVFEAAGYGEIYTPALEHESELARGGAPGTPAYRLFDEHGGVLALRADMTIPIARVAATRYATAEPPLRFCYFAHVYRPVRPQRGQAREFLQAGIELLGKPAPEGTVEALTVLCDALDAAGLRDYRIGLGDAALYPFLLDALNVPEDARERIVDALVARDFVALEGHVRALDLDARDRETLITVPQRRGGPEVLRDAPEAASGVLGRLRAFYEGLPKGVAARVIFDLGLLRSPGYYTGAVFEVYDPAVGVPIGGGGRYDELLGRFGRPMPAVGFALAVERLHIALTGEEEQA
jgi:ATP phosphoribosyltransferase regulatory subunit